MIAALYSLFRRNLTTRARLVSFGLAALAILARRLPPLLPKNHRTILFVAFNGEEIGLAGSSHYVEKPVVPLTDTNLMLNLDMIGRMKDQGLVVLGTESGTAIEAWTREAGEAQKLNLKIDLDFLADLRQASEEPDGGGKRPPAL